MIIDGLVVFVLFVSAFISFFRGFIREALTIFGIVGGMVAAYIGGPLLVPLMSGWLGIVDGAEPQKLYDVIPYPMLAQVLSYGSILIVFVIILSILSHFLAEGARSLGLGALDRTLGVIFGLARGILLLGLLYLPAYYFMDQETKDKWFQGSKSFLYLEATSGAIAGYIPAQTKENMQAGAEKLKEVNQTREKLQDMGLLNQGTQDGGKNPPDQKELSPQKVTPAPKDGNKEGYSEEIRSKMNKLIEEVAPPAQPAEESQHQPNEQTNQ